LFKSRKATTILALAAILAISLYIAVIFSPKAGISTQSNPSATIEVQDQVLAVNSTTDAHSAMLARGDIAMGFDQNKIMHHFMATSTGGRIMIVALDSNDSETIEQIKSHVLDIQYEFSQGYFTKPFFIHDQEVPGTDVMAVKKDLIEYSVQDLDSGATLVLTTDDAELLKAIQQFMAFQGSEHQGH
jgi:hypothetical protein